MGSMMTSSAQMMVMMMPVNDMLASVLEMNANAEPKAAMATETPRNMPLLSPAGLAAAGGAVAVAVAAATAFGSLTTFVKSAWSFFSASPDQLSILLSTMFQRRLNGASRASRTQTGFSTN